MKLKQQILAEIATNPNDPKHIENVRIRYRSFMTQRTFDEIVKQSGLVKTPNWKQAENDLLKEYKSNPQEIALKLKQAGFDRTPQAIIARVCGIKKGRIVIGGNATDLKLSSNDNFTSLHIEHEQPQRPDMENSGGNQRAIARRRGGIG